MIDKMLRGATPLLAAGVLVLNIAHVAAQPPPNGAPGAPPGGGFQLPSLPRQGFENTGQDPANYTPAERTAVAVVEKLIDTMNHHDTAGHMALIAPNCDLSGRPDRSSAEGRSRSLLLHDRRPWPESEGQTLRWKSCMSWTRGGRARPY